jgi:hypothetical protein
MRHAIRARGERAKEASPHAGLLLTYHPVPDIA